MRRRSWRLAPLAMAVPVLLAAACAPRLGPLPPEGGSLVQVWAERRADFPSVRALADVQVGAAREAAWPRFTAVFTYARPDRVSVAAFDTFGRGLFTWEASGVHYTLTDPDHARPHTGRLDAPGTRAEARLLGALTHLVDGVLGPETGEGKAGVDAQGRWVVRRGGETVAYAIADGRVERLEVRRRGAATVRIRFGDWREAGPLEAPHRIDLALPDDRVTATMRVEAWRLEGATEAPGAGEETRAALDLKPEFAYFDVPSKGGTHTRPDGTDDAGREGYGAAPMVAPAAEGRVH